MQSLGYVRPTLPLLVRRCLTHTHTRYELRAKSRGTLNSLPSFLLHQIQCLTLKYMSTYNRTHTHAVSHYRWWTTVAGSATARPTRAISRPLTSDDDDVHSHKHHRWGHKRERKKVFLLTVSERVCVYDQGNSCDRPSSNTDHRLPYVVPGQSKSTEREG